MKNNVSMIFYCAAVLSFYVGELVLFVNAASVAGLSLIGLGLVCLALGFAFHWRAVAICEAIARKASACGMGAAAASI